MTVFETVSELAALIRDAQQTVQGEWSDESGLVAWVDEDGVDRILIARRRTVGPRRSEEDWLSHPAVFVFEDEGQYAAVPPVIALAGWVLDGGALEAVLAAEVAPEYARAAHRAGVTDAWELIDLWRDGVPVEYLSAL